MRKYGAVDLKGITGAVQATRWVGGTTSGPPTTGTFAVGDFVTSQGATVWICTVAGSPGTWLLAGGVLVSTFAGQTAAAASNKDQLAVFTDVAGGTLYRSTGSAWAAIAPGLSKVYPFVGSVAPAGAKAETISRFAGAASATVAAGTTGQLRMVGIMIPGGSLITSITFVSGSTALASGTHGWAALFSTGATPSLLRQSTDDASITWAASTAKTFTLSSTYTTADAAIPQQFYLGLLITAGTMPTLSGFAGSGTLNAIAQINSGTADSGLTTTAPSPTSTLTAVGGVPYAYVS